MMSFDLQNIDLAKFQGIEKSSVIQFKPSILRVAEAVVFTFFCLGCVLYSISCGSETDVAALIIAPSRNVKQFDLAVTEKLVLGRSDTLDARYLFGRPAFLLTDRSGDIYVADRLSSSIKVYDRKGRYLRSIGRRGSGPGELHYITSMSIGPENDLFVVDHVNRRTIRFSALGELRSFYPLSQQQMYPPFQLSWHAPSGGFLLLYRDRENNRLLHLFDPKFSQKQFSFVSFESTWSAGSPFVELHVNYDPGNISLDTTGNVWYAPTIYDGRLYRTTYDGDWNATQAVLGHAASTESLSEIEIPPFPNDSYVHRSRDGTFAGVIHSESIGLFQLNDGRIIHFTRFLSSGALEHRVEIFGSNGMLLGYGVLSGEAWLSSGNIQVLWKDLDDQFYILDRSSTPIIRVVQIDISG